MKIKKTEAEGQRAFLVNIRRTEGHTWQGDITWIAKKNTAHFRSALEMIKLIDSAIGGETAPSFQKEETDE